MPRRRPPPAPSRSRQRACTGAPLRGPRPPRLPRRSSRRRSPRSALSPRRRPPRRRRSTAPRGAGAPQTTASTGSDATASARPPRTVASSVPCCSRARSRARSIAALARRRAGPETPSSSASSAKRTRTSYVGGVLERREQVLDDAVGGQLDRRGQDPRVALHRQPRVRAFGVHEQRFEMRQRRLRPRRELGRVVAQHADDGAHLLERGPARALDVDQRRRRRRAVAGAPAFAPPCVRAPRGGAGAARRAAGHARAVGGDLQPGALVARLAQLRRALLQLVRDLPARAHDPADSPHDHGRGPEDGAGHEAEGRADIERGSRPERARVRRRPVGLQAARRP